MKKTIKFLAISIITEFFSSFIDKDANYFIETFNVALKNPL